MYLMYFIHAKLTFTFICCQKGQHTDEKPSQHQWGRGFSLLLNTKPPLPHQKKKKKLTKHFQQVLSSLV